MNTRSGATAMGLTHGEIQSTKHLSSCDGWMNCVRERNGEEDRKPGGKNRVKEVWKVWG